MTELRLLENQEGEKFVEVSYARSNLSRSFLVPVVPTGDASGTHPAEIMKFRWGGNEWVALYLLLFNVPRPLFERDFSPAVTLAETDSINILNYLLDTLAYGR